MEENIEITWNLTEMYFFYVIKLSNHLYIDSVFLPGKEAFLIRVVIMPLHPANAKNFSTAFQKFAGELLATHVGAVLGLKLCQIF